MTHEISTTVQGTTEAVFGFGEVPWWNSSTLKAAVMDRAVSFDEVFSIAFPWSAQMEQLCYADGSLSSQHGIRRSDTLAELGVHSGAYGNIQPRDLFDFCAAFFEESQVPIASAIAMKGGKVLNISARLGELNILGSGDIHRSYLCFVNSFDGSMKAEVYKSYVQPVCMNTTRSGLASADFKMVYKHTKHVQKRIQSDITQVQQLMLAQQATNATVQATLEALAKVKPTKTSYQAILDELFGDSDSKRSQNTKAQFTAIVANGVNATAYPDFKGTGYGIYTALTDYVDHYQTVRQTDARADQDIGQIRFERSMIGDGAKLKQKGLEILERVLVLADGTEEKPKRFFMPVIDDRVALTSTDDTITVGDKSITYVPQEPVIDSPLWDTPIPETAYVKLYTTSPEKFDLLDSSTDHVAEVVNTNVCVRCVNVPTALEDTQKAAWSEQGYAVFTLEQWLGLGKQE